MNDVGAFWNSRAADPSLDDTQVTHPDVWQRWLEIELTKRYLQAADRVLDVGCGAGAATLQFAAVVRQIVGLDASPGMVERALRARGGAVPTNAEFRVGSVLELAPEMAGLFDAATSIRCLINLPDWPAQESALRRIASVIRPGGLLILAEGSSEGREGLNRLREEAGLARLPPVWHNRDFQEGQLLSWLDEVFILRHRHALGVYDLVSRVVHPLLVAPDPPSYAARINELAARTALAQDGLPGISRLLFLVLERR